MALDLLVTSAGPTRDRLQRNLPSHGIAVHGIDVTGRAYDLGEPGELAPTTPDVGFVFPSRITEGDVLTAALDLPWVNGRETILTTRNKAGTLARLAAASVPIPRTVSFSAPLEYDELIRQFRTFDGPVVIKPNNTTRGTGHVLVDDVDSLRGVVDYLDLVHTFPATEDRTFLMQAFVPDTRDCRLTVLDGHVAGAVERRLPEGDGGWVKNVHRGADAVSIDPPERVRTLAERAVEVLDIAMAGVDVLVGPDQAVVLEVNGRPTIDRAEKYPPDFYERLADLITQTASGNID